MTITFDIIVITLSIICTRTSTSIVGVTYRDDFDFEQRYSNLHDCDPFYWHPLHLPEECADMYEDLIREQLAKRGVKRPRSRRKPRTRTRQKSAPPSEETDEYYPFEETYASLYDYNENQRRLTPYEKMLQSVQQDVNNLPSVPKVQTMPNFGPVAVYQQPISQISVDMIKKIALKYSSQDDDEKGKRHSKKSASRWRQLVDSIRRREQNGWKKINNGELVSLSRL